MKILCLMLCTVIYANPTKLSEREGAIGDLQNSSNQQVINDNYEIPSNVTDGSGHNNGSSEGTWSWSTTTVMSEVPSSIDSWYSFNTAKLVVLCIVSLSIPMVFMIMLMWRIQKEKKYLNPRNGALVYSETIIVPSYTIANTIDGSSGFTVIQMHNTLYDTPPAYETVIKTTSDKLQSEKQLTNITEVPPPAYSTVHL